MIVNSIPPKVHTAYNPAIINLSPDGETKAKIKIAIQGSEFYGYHTFEHEFFNDIAKFDISKYVQKFFSDTLSERNVPGNIIPCYIDFNSCVNYWIYDETNSFMQMNGVDVLTNNSPLQLSVNSVAQLGESSDMTSKYNTFLTKFEKIKLYKDFIPAWISVLSGEQTNLKIELLNSNKTSILYSTINDKCFVITAPLNNVFSPDYISQIRTKINNEVVSAIDIEMVDCPSNPFYVKWINQSGGWDYWMFNDRQFYSQKISDQTLSLPYIEDQQNSKSFEEIISFSADTIVKVGTGAMNKNEYTEVSKLIFSKNIQYYNITAGKWQNIRLESQSNNFDTEAEYKEAEYSFYLPTPQLQQ